MAPPIPNSLPASIPSVSEPNQRAEMGETSQEADRQRDNDEPLEHIQLTVSPPFLLGGSLLPDENVDNTSSTQSSIPSSTWPSRSSSPVSVVGLSPCIDIAQDTPLPPSTQSSTDVVNSPDAAYEISPPFPPETMIGRSDQNYDLNIKDIWNGSYRQEAKHLLARIREISEWLPHLGILLARPGIKFAPSGRVKSYQISESGSNLEVIDEFKVVNASKRDQVRDYFSRKTFKQGTGRIILVEDLNPRLIEGLYSVFGIGPEIFAEHLNRSGYGSSTYTDPDPSTWNFRSPKKNYISIRWYRPVYKEEIVEMPASARIGFVNAHQVKWRERQRIQDDSGQPRRARLTHRLMRCTNISRQERPLSSVMSDPWQTNSRRIMATIEERVTVYTEERQGQKISVALLDPLPYLRYSRTIEVRAEDDAQVETRRELPVLPIQPRSPPPVSSVDELLHTGALVKSKAFFETPTSMLQDMEAWMAEYANHSLPENANCLFIAILEIVSRDTRTTFSLLTAALSEISLGSMDDSQGEERLAYWQTLIRSYQTDLPLMRDSLHEFVHWGFSGNVPSYVWNMVDDLASRTDDLIQRVEKAHDALRAELSILESKRGIAEAEGVARLTELAFIFIPLTFSASLFSMQVRELQDSTPTLVGFVGTCLLFLSLSYGVRLAVRSRVFLDWKRELFQRIRFDSEFVSKNVPTRVFVTWILKQVFPERADDMFWKFSFFFILAVLAPVVALVWTKSKIDKGLKTVLTILLISLAFTVGFYAVVKRFSKFRSKFRNWLVDFKDFFSLFARRRRAEGQGSGQSV